MKKQMVGMLLILGAAFAFSGCASHLQQVSVVGAEQCISRGTVDGGGSGAIKIEKTMPKEVVPGKAFEYTITATNLCDCGLEGVVITEKFAGTLEGKSALPAAKITADAAEWGVGPMKGREAKVLKITGVAKSSVPFTTITEAVYSLAPCHAAKGGVPALKIVLDVPARVVLCDPIPAKLTITNQGTAKAKDVKVTQDFPKGIEALDHRILLSERVGDLAVGASRSLLVVLKAQKAGRYVHQASAMTVDGVSATSAQVTTEVLEPVLKTGIDGPEKVLIGRNADYKLGLQNAGNTDAIATTVTAAIPASMQFVSASSGGKASPGAIAWEVGTLGVGKQIFLNATLKAVKAGPSQIGVTAKGRCCQEASAKTKTEVTGIAAVRLEVVDAEDPIQVGEVEKFVVTVTNQGSAASRNVSVKMYFEENFEYVSSTGPTQGRAEEVKSVEFAPLGSLEPGQKVSWEVKAKAISEGDHRTGVTMKCDAVKREVHEEESTRVY